MLKRKLQMIMLIQNNFFCTTDSNSGRERDLTVPNKLLLVNTNLVVEIFQPYNLYFKLAIFSSATKQQVVDLYCIRLGSYIHAHVYSLH